MLNEPFRLSSKSDRTKVLSVDSDGNIHYAPQTSTDNEILWMFLLPPMGYNGYYIVSENLGWILSYDPSKTEQVMALPYVDGAYETATLWSISSEGEIYTTTMTGDKKYLWTVLDGVYVTHDEHLAENWTLKTPTGRDLTPPKSIWSWCIWLLLIGLIGLLIYLLYRKFQNK
jgi:hypothetical protein